MLSTTLLQPTGKKIQTRLHVNRPGDALEQQADAAADRIMLGLHVNQKPGYAAGEGLQRKCAHCEEEEKLHRSQLNPGSGQTQQLGASFSKQLSRQSGGGKPLEPGLQQGMSNSFSADFTSVRIHNDGIAARLSSQINARAFTYGSDIYFNSGQYNTSTTDGKRLLAHELAHVVQQNGKGNTINRSCSDGACDSCAGGMRRLTFTVFFRIPANRANMTRIRSLVNEAKRDFRRCCINASFFFDWRLLRGGGTFDPGVERPAGSADGTWDYDDASEALGEGNTFNGARGVPIVFADTVPRTGGGVTMTNRYDAQYTGRTYMAVSVNQPDAIASTFAHEFGHVAGLEHDNALPATNIMNTGTDIDDRFCTAARAMAR